ncbi:type VI secretion system lipoprotein TssJ [Vibrio sp. LaRot3]|uniref:type VI secretion system lipoprotein TssJ n=1 Tax=Vibrio sp. LaRot3 TaxID=2998829 RepID=UPI0022CDDFC4|nr:type VI secretion system lipoprotein TssJ [Vibrio sp. LaRot3]MDA0149654.1 type VI secretion system lipoprotein TssJ [Vibrio sp. LaRot3]
MKKWLFPLLLTLAACSSDPEPVLSKYTLKIDADKAINATDNNATNPVVVRVYQLTDAQQFKQLDFIDLYQDDITLLGDNLISKQVLPVVMPDSKSEQALDINSQTQFIAVLVEFANYESSEAKVVTATPKQTEQFLQLNINGNTVAIEAVTPDSSWWDVF